MSPLAVSLPNTSKRQFRNSQSNLSNRRFRDTRRHPVTLNAIALPCIESAVLWGYGIRIHITGCVGGHIGLAENLSAGPGRGRPNPLSECPGTLAF